MAGLQHWQQSSVQLMDYISALEKALDQKAVLDLMPMQDGDVPATEADVSALEEDFSYRPRVQVEEGNREIR